MTAKEFWKKKFGKHPQTDNEELAVAMMEEYAQEQMKQFSLFTKHGNSKGSELFCSCNPPVVGWIDTTVYSECKLCGKEIVKTVL